MASTRQPVILLIGHRGTGKTSFASRLSASKVIDLDTELATRAAKPIAELLKAGEVEFRRQESALLQELVEQASPDERTVIVVGAGCETLPSGTHRLWLRRETDASGRCFLNRPRLNEAVSPFAEYMQRFAEREARYRSWADEQLFVPEGYEGGLEDFLDGNLHLPYALTLLPEHCNANLAQFIAKRLKWGVRLFELRDDLLSKEQLKLALSIIPSEKTLYASRAEGKARAIGVKQDWALELGAPIGSFDVVSMHQRGTDLESDLRRLTSLAGETAVQKAALEINSFDELLLGHRWWQEHPQRRAFLPRSSDGRWRWYRSLFGPQMPLHFIREGEGSALDQPLLWQCVLQLPLTKNFAAVLGKPVKQSRTPIEQRSFFAERKMPVVAIPVAEDDFDQAWPALRQLGLTHAAVTSPLKSRALALADERSAEAKRTGAANTLVIHDGRLYAHNTDYLALKDWQRELGPQQKVWIWGRGALLPTLQELWPQAEAISAREGINKGSEQGPDLLIWATNRSRPFTWPTVRPGQILDLNYTDDSPGLELAVALQRPYHSGLKQFKLQADWQRRFWSKM